VDGCAVIFRKQWGALNMSDWRNVQLHEALCAAVETEICGYVRFSRGSFDIPVKGIVSRSTAQLDKDEQKMVEQRLRDLGYV
jgi:hypothetical protein